MILCTATAFLGAPLISYGLFNGGALATAFSSGFVFAGVASGGDLRSAAVGGVTALGFGGIGAGLQNGMFNTYEAIGLHGAVGGLSNLALGGKFGPGFVAAGFAKFSAPYANLGGPSADTIAVAVIGGTASSIGGGKFANGAATAAFGYLFNELAHPRTRDRSIYAAENGDVETLGWENPNNHKQGYGYRLKLRADGDGSLFVYAHIDPSSLTVSLNDSVTQGQLLGQYASPANGGATGPHLHFEWWSKTGARLDPGSYLPMVMPNHVLKDTIRFRSVHPVTGKARWHNGYDLVGPWSQP